MMVKMMISVEMMVVFVVEAPSKSKGLEDGKQQMQDLLTEVNLCHCQFIYIFGSSSCSCRW